MSAPVYDKAYFIAKFEAIPDEKWCKEVYTDDYGRHCALGHCGDGLEVLTREGWELKALLDSEVAPINDGAHPSYQQPTPKQRILAALRSLP